MQAEWLRQQLDAIEIGAKPGSDTQPEQVLEVKQTQTLHIRPRSCRALRIGAFRHWADCRLTGLSRLHLFCPLHAHVHLCR